MAAIVLAVALTVTGTPSSSRADRPPTRGPIVAVSPMVDFDEQFELEAERARISAYLEAVHAAELEAERLAVEQYLRSLPRPGPVPASTPVQQSSGPVGQCGGATNGADQFIARESGGNPYISNTQGSGAYGCYQIMPGTWNGSCRDLGPQIGAPPSVQAQCASRLPLSAWQ